MYILKIKVLDPTLIEKYQSAKVAYDGDCDRVFFIDEKGEMLQSDFVTAMIAQEMLKKDFMQPVFENNFVFILKNNLTSLFLGMILFLKLIQ